MEAVIQEVIPMDLLNQCSRFHWQCIHNVLICEHEVIPGECMIQQEILDVVDAFLEGRITHKEALLKTKILMKKVKDPCDDPPSALTTILIGLEPDPHIETPDPGKVREELLLARKVLKRGVPCPDKEQRKTMDTFFYAYKAGEYVVLCQIKKSEKGERVLEFIEESWEGKQTFYQKVPIPLKKTAPPLSKEALKEKENAYKKQNLTREKALQWVITQLQRKGTFKMYKNLLDFYWILLRPGQFYESDGVHYGMGDYLDKW